MPPDPTPESSPESRVGVKNQEMEMVKGFKSFIILSVRVGYKLGRSFLIKAPQQF